MKAKELLLFGCTSLVALAVCALAGDKPAQTKQAQSATTHAQRPAVTVTMPAPDSPVIGFLEKRGQTITIKAGPKGPVYSAKSTDGKTLFENLSLEQLRAQAPEIHELIKTAVAGASGKPGVVLDAGLRPTR